MKMITAIVNKKDAGDVCRTLTEEGYYFTKMASVGGFLSTGNITLMIGTDEENVPQVLDIIHTHSRRRVEPVNLAVHFSGTNHALPSEVTVGGATVFVTNVEYFEKM